MEIPLKITDKRYVTAWNCEIKDEKGNTVRTISNKTPLREMKDAASFFKVSANDIIRREGSDFAALSLYL